MLFILRQVLLFMLSEKDACNFFAADIICVSSFQDKVHSIIRLNNFFKRPVIGGIILKAARRQIFKYLYLFLFGGLCYYLIEILWRGYSHISMMVVGGLCFVLIGLINEGILRRNMPLLLQMSIAAGIVTVVEFIAGMILNVWLGLGIWDYSNLPFNLCGQITLYFVFLWFLLSMVAIVLDDCIRLWFFGEPKPRYMFWGKKDQKRNKK